MFRYPLNYINNKIEIVFLAKALNITIMRMHYLHTSSK